MRTTYTRTVAMLTALAAGVLAAFALRPSPATTVTLAARNPAVEVRTEVIRRTIHIIKHVAGAGGFGSPAGAAYGHRSGSVRTGASRSHSAGAPAGNGVAFTTHVSGSHSSAVGTTYAGGTVRTRTSASRHGSSGSGSTGGPVTTRTSGSRHASGPASGPVTTHTSGSSGSGKPVHTRTSGTHVGEGGDGGNGGGDN